MKLRHSINSQQQKGFTLIEVLIAIAIGLVIIAATYSYFIATLKTSKSMLIQSGMQQELRTSAELMQRDLRRAGYKPKDDANDVSKVFLGRTKAQVDAGKTAKNCVLYSYIDENGNLRASGFSIDSGKLYMYIKSDTIANTCPANPATNSAWEAMTVSTLGKASDFTVTPDITGSRPLLRIYIKGEAMKSNSDSSAASTLEISEQIILQNLPTIADAATGS